MLSEKRDGPDPDGQDALKAEEKGDKPQRAAEMELADPCVLRPWFRPCRMDLLVTRVRRRFRIVLRSSRSSEF